MWVSDLRGGVRQYFWYGAEAWVRSRSCTSNLLFPAWLAGTAQNFNIRRGPLVNGLDGRDGRDGRGIFLGGIRNTMLSSPPRELHGRFGFPPCIKGTDN